MNSNYEKRNYTARKDLYMTKYFFCRALFSVSTQNITQVKAHLLFLTRFLKGIRLMQSCCLNIYLLPYTFAVAFEFESILSLNLTLQSWRNQIPGTSMGFTGRGEKNIYG